MTRKQLHLGAFAQASGHHVAAWRHSNAPARAAVDFKHHLAMARLAEEAKFDLFFLADIASIWESSLDAMSQSARSDRLAPTTLLAALAVTTERIGLVATATASYNEPYHVAREFATLDHLSNGRAGWNLVTSNNESEALNFGREAHFEHGERYRRAAEFADVVTSLWDGWGDGAFKRDKASGIYFDPSRFHRIDHKGEHFSVRGPLNVEPSPQGRPVIVQAGSSEAGRDLAAQTGEVIFTAQSRLEDAQSFFADVKGRMSGYGRAPEDMKILPGLLPIVGRTRTEAEGKFQELQDLIAPAVGVGLLSASIGHDLSRYPLDGSLPDLPSTNAYKSRQQLLVDLARRDRLTIRELAWRIAGGRGHFMVVGTPADVADVMQEWLEADGADGFNVMPAMLPDGLVDFVELVIPELRRRELFRTEYQGSTLRQHLGLRRSPSRPAAAGGA